MVEYESNLKRYRVGAGLTQEALAQEVGVSRQTIVNIEKGRNEPGILLALAIAGAVGLAIGAIEELFRKRLMW